MDFLISWSDITALLTVVAIDVALAGDNALVVGMAAAGLAKPLRRRAIGIGIAAAAALRVLFAGVAMRLMEIVGMAAAGGLLLLWVCWKLWREIRAQEKEREAVETLGGANHQGEGKPPKTLNQAVAQIFLADLSMSLDNVLAVAGAARERLWVLTAGLGFSVIMMAFAASLIARIIHRHRWIAYVGLLIILYVSLSMIWEGTHSVMHFLARDTTHGG